MQDQSNQDLIPHTKLVQKIVLTHRNKKVMKTTRKHLTITTIVLVTLAPMIATANSGNGINPFQGFYGQFSTGYESNSFTNTSLRYTNVSPLSITAAAPISPPTKQLQACRLLLVWATTFHSMKNGYWALARTIHFLRKPRVSSQLEIPLSYSPHLRLGSN